MIAIAVADRPPPPFPLQVSTGKDTRLIKRFGAELDTLGVPNWQRDVCLIWDEVNLLGQVRRQ